jgi:hypothetical protein
MISSRCNDLCPAKGGTTTLTDIRKKLKQQIELVSPFGKQLFEVWINEETPPTGGSWSSWDVCLNAVKDCDILLALSNGNAGWAKSAGDIGICHAELMTGLSEGPGKVWLISLGNVPIDSSEQGERNRRFQEFVALQNLFRGAEVKTIAELEQRVKEALNEALLTLVQRGVRESSRGRYYSGQALDWTRLNFANRQREMLKVLREAVLQRSSATEDSGNVFVSLGSAEVLFVLHAIPAAIGVPAARELVGQPFLQDHTLHGLFVRRRVGPMHVIACHRSATEAQATKLLGFPDATVVNAPFGIYVADNVQKVQFAFVCNCRDDATTRHGVQRFFDWLEQTGEGALLASRAASRARIVKAIAKEA